MEGEAAHQDFWSEPKLTGGAGWPTGPGGALMSAVRNYVVSRVRVAAALRSGYPKPPPFGRGEA
jgi:hypothetical protein